MRTTLRVLFGLLIVALVGPIGVATAAPLPAQLTPPDRKLLYRTHVDAAHIAYEDGGLKVKVIDGQTAVPADTVYVRLGPDANREGVETSRIQVPERHELSFLGRPGRILWSGPQTSSPDNAPVWPGYGSGAFPNDVVDSIYPEKVEITLQKLEGPGDVEVFTWNASTGDVKRLFSSTDERYKNRWSKSGNHGHMNWTFTEAGRYHFTWQAQMTKRDGTVVKSEPTVVTWLVGTDADVNLPEGTTKRNPITSFTGNFAPKGFTAIEGDKVPTNTTPPAPGNPVLVPAATRSPSDFFPLDKPCIHATADKHTLTGSKWASPSPSIPLRPPEHIVVAPRHAMFSRAVRPSCSPPSTARQSPRSIGGSPSPRAPT